MDLQEQHPDVTFIGVPEPNGDTSSSASFIDGTGSGSLTHLHDPDGTVWNAFGVTRRQTYIVVGADGATSTVDFDNLSASVDELVAS